MSEPSRRAGKKKGLGENSEPLSLVDLFTRLSSPTSANLTELPFPNRPIFGMVKHTNPIKL